MAVKMYHVLPLIFASILSSLFSEVHSMTEEECERDLNIIADAIHDSMQNDNREEYKKACKRFREEIDVCQSNWNSGETGLMNNMYNQACDSPEVKEWLSSDINCEGDIDRITDTLVSTKESDNKELHKRACGNFSEIITQCQSKVNAETNEIVNKFFTEACNSSEAKTWLASGDECGKDLDTLADTFFSAMRTKNKELYRKSCETFHKKIGECQGQWNTLEKDTANDSHAKACESYYVKKWLSSGEIDMIWVIAPICLIVLVFALLVFLKVCKDRKKMKQNDVLVQP